MSDEKPQQENEGGIGQSASTGGLGAWLPIETAPKRSNGYSTAYLVYCPENKCIFCVSFYERSNAWFYFGGGGILEHKPTHWMPLPEPPNA